MYQLEIGTENVTRKKKKSEIKEQFVLSRNDKANPTPTHSWLTHTHTHTGERERKKKMYLIVMTLKKKLLVKNCKKKSP